MKIKGQKHKNKTELIKQAVKNYHEITKNAKKK